MNYKCYFDGACKLNPGHDIGVGGYVECDSEVVYEFGNQIHTDKMSSNNVAEYMALETIIDFLLNTVSKDDKVDIYGDSRMTVMQVSGRWKPKNGLYKETATRVIKKYNNLKNLTTVTLNWIPREQNQRADDLSKSDTKQSEMIISLMDEYLS